MKYYIRSSQENYLKTYHCSDDGNLDKISKLDFSKSGKELGFHVSINKDAAKSTNHKYLYRVYLDPSISNCNEAYDLYGNWASVEICRILVDLGCFPDTDEGKRAARDLVNSEDNLFRRAESIRDRFISNDIHALQYENLHEDPKATSYVLFDNYYFEHIEKEEEN